MNDTEPSVSYCFFFFTRSGATTVFCLHLGKSGFTLQAPLFRIQFQLSFPKFEVPGILH